MTDARCTDDELRAIEQTDPNPRARAAAAELLAIRVERRRDSRRAEQIRKARWTVEHLLAKVEGLARQWGDEAIATSTEPDGAE